MRINIFDYILYFGLFGTSSFIVFVKNSFKRLGNLSIDEMDRKRIFILGFYLLVFLGIIDITIKAIFTIFFEFILTLQINMIPPFKIY